MYGTQVPGQSVAAAAGTKCAAEGLGFGGCSVILNLNLRCGALAVNGVVFAVGYIAADTCDFAFTNLFITHYCYLQRFLPTGSV